MNKSEAIQAHDKLRECLERDYNNPVARNWVKANVKCPDPKPYADGWIFVYKTDPDPHFQGKPFEAILVRPDGQSYLVLGACARLWNVYDLGFPRTQERFLGSTRGGKYQNFERGMAVWEGEPDLGYRVSYKEWGLSPDGTETATCTGFVAFSDLRGFTNWSQKESTSSAMIQEILSGVERCFQQAFARTWCTSLFVKGTGDGMMIVSEAGSSDQSIPNHAQEFTRACCRFVRDAQDILPPNELAIGIGVDYGKFHRVFLLGRRDYVGMRINEAAKIQQLAWNEVVMSEEHASRLRKDGVDIDAMAKPLPGKGYRLDVWSFLGQDNDVWQNEVTINTD